MFGIVEPFDNAQMSVIETHAWLARSSNSSLVPYTNRVVISCCQITPERAGTLEISGVFWSRFDDEI
jgi:hypothetical protein